jgi:hypothetical protein
MTVQYDRLCGEAGSAVGGVTMHFLKVAASGLSPARLQVFTCPGRVTPELARQD